MNDIKIFTAFHKEFQIPKDDFHIPIHVWKALSNIELPYEWDNTWDNISKKNSNYCELTMLYWVWKNYKIGDNDYVGLAHYRRLFDVNTLKDIYRYDIIVPKKHLLTSFTTHISLESQYKLVHIPEDFDLMKDILYSKYPEYKNYDYIFSKQHLFYLRWYFYNMFIMRYKLFLEYSERLFNILFEVENKIKISSNSYQARVFWFMWERLFNIYMEKKRCEGYKIAEKNILIIK